MEELSRASKQAYTHVLAWRYVDVQVWRRGDMKAWRRIGVQAYVPTRRHGDMHAHV
jgi:hypothetical protein